MYVSESRNAIKPKYIYLVAASEYTNKLTSISHCWLCTIQSLSKFLQLIYSWMCIMCLVKSTMYTFPVIPDTHTFWVTQTRKCMCTNKMKCMSYECAHVSSYNHDGELDIVCGIKLNNRIGSSLGFRLKLLQPRSDQHYQMSCINVHQKFGCATSFDVTCLIQK